MTRQGAINTAMAQGYGIRYNRNPKCYEIYFNYSDGSDSLEWTGNTYEEAMNQMEQIGYTVAEMMMGI